MRQREPPRVVSAGEGQLIAAEIALPGKGWGTRSRAVGWLAPVWDWGTLILTRLGEGGRASLLAGSRNANRVNHAASLLHAGEVTLRGSSIQLAPNLPFGWPGDEGDSSPSRQQWEINV